MAFNNAPGRQEYIASAGQTIFTFPFKIFLDGDIKVYQTPAGQDPNDTNDILILTTDYTVTINGDLGGTATLVTGASSGDSITLVRELSLDRLIEYQTSGDLLADTLNLDQDYQTYLIADQDTQHDRYISIPDSAQNISTDLPDVVANSYLKWNSAGDALENDTTLPDSVSIVEGYKDDAEKFAYGDPVGSGTTTKGAQQYAEDSQVSADNSEDSNLESESWANEDKDVPVKEYTNGVPSDRVPERFSAKHYSEVASGSVGRTSARNVAISASASGVLATTVVPTPSHIDVPWIGNGTTQNIVTGLPSESRPWVASASYTIGQYRTHGDNYIYEALTTHSGVATTPDLDTTNWAVVADGVVVDANNIDLWIKCRDSAFDNVRVDSLIGSSNFLKTNTTDAEATSSALVQSFNTNGFTVGATSTANNNLSSYVAWCEYFDKMVSGVTANGKRYVEAFNAQSGKGMIIRVGSGAVDTVPHSLGTKIDFSVTKSRTTIRDWYVYNHVSSATEFTYLNQNLASSANSTVWNDTEPTEFNFTLGTSASINKLDDNFIDYYSSNRNNHSYVGGYVGTGAFYNKVDVGMDLLALNALGKNIKVMIKQLVGSTGSWVLFDNTRSSGTVFNDYLTADSSSAEVVDASLVTISLTESGVSIDGTSGWINTDGYQYLIEVTVEDFDNPTGGLDIPAGSVISHAEGTDDNGGDLDTIQPTTLHSDIALITGATNYIAMDKGDTPYVTTAKPLKGNDILSADRWGVVSPSDATLKTTDKHSDYASATGVVSASSELTTYLSIKAFDKIIGTSGDVWITNGTTTGWIEYAYSEKRVLKTYRFNNTSAPTRSPKDWIIEGSNDGITWETIDTVTGYVSGSAYSWSPVYTVDIESAYSNIRMNVTLNNGDVSYLALAQLELNTEPVPSDFYKVDEGIMYDSSDVQQSRVYLGEVVVDASGDIIPETLIEYQVGHLDVPELEVHGDTVLHGDTVISGGFEQNRVWSNVFTDRLSGVTYTNTGDKELHVSACVTSASNVNGYIQLAVGNNLVVSSRTQVDSLVSIANAYGVVPIGETYKVTAVTGDLSLWMELR